MRENLNLVHLIMTVHSAMHKIPLELKLTEKLEKHSLHVRTFAGNPIRLHMVTLPLVHLNIDLLKDNSVPVTICSFHQTLKNKNRSEELLEIVKDCNLSISEVLMLLQNAFSWNFQQFHAREAMAASAWNRSLEKLNAQGFKFFHKKYYMPANDSYHL